ncbi:MAG TPA: RidA family protein [Longimicrobiaceae bacterium]|nr:RidA family protein [Longimicrobiaceae bacterium]
MTDHTRAWEPVLPGDTPAPLGNYSPAVRAGDFLYVSGQVPGDPEKDVADQTRQVLAKLEGVLRSAGASLDDVVSVNAYLADIGDWAEFNRAYGEVFRPPYPTRTTVGAQLVGVRVEISAVAYLPR